MMICCKCKKLVERSYGTVTDLGNYCRQCAIENEIQAEDNLNNSVKNLLRIHYNAGCQEAVDLHRNAVQDTASICLEKFISELVNRRLLKPSGDMYNEMIELKDEILKKFTGEIK